MDKDETEHLGIFDDFSNYDSVSESNFQAGDSQGVDILKQSLQAANITEQDSCLSFSNEFDYLSGGNSSNLNLDLSSTPKIKNEAVDDNMFDTSQFLNLTNDTNSSQSSKAGTANSSLKNNQYIVNPSTTAQYQTLQGKDGKVVTVNQVFSTSNNNSLCPQVVTSVPIQINQSTVVVNSAVQLQNGYNNNGKKVQVAPGSCKVQFKGQYYLTSKSTTNQQIKKTINNNSPFVGMQIASVKIPITCASSTLPQYSNNLQSIRVASNGQTASHQVIVLPKKRPISEVNPTSSGQHTLNVIRNLGNKVKPPSANVCNSVLDTNKTVRRKYNGQTYAVSPADAMADKLRNTTNRNNFVNFTVDPGLSAVQINQVQKIIREKRTDTSKLTQNQSQLYTAFWAHVHPMEQHIREYYIKHPQLFTSKVKDHFRKSNGSPFVITVKTKPGRQIQLPKRPNSTEKSSLTSSVSQTAINKVVQQHPTISLSKIQNLKSSNQLTQRVHTVAGTRGLGVRHLLAVPTQNSLKRSHTVTNKSSQLKTLIAQGTVKSEPCQPPTPKKPLILSKLDEKLVEQQQMLLRPDTQSPFANMKDCVDRLLPYHLYTVPEIPIKVREESEKIFDKIAEDKCKRVQDLYSKYHRLLLKDFARPVFNPDSVMLARIFLQDERLELLQDKKCILADPVNLTHYLNQDDQNQARLFHFLKDEADQRANEVLRARELALSKKNMASRIENEQAVNSIL